MSGMIERIAMSILEKPSFSNMDDFCIDGAYMLEEDIHDLSSVRVDGVIDLLNIVRTVILAMREPSDEMECAALDLGPDQDPLAYWQAMIDAAMKED